jgi:hypothetical protein
MSLSQKECRTIASRLEYTADHREDAPGAYLAYIGVAEAILTKPDGSPREPDPWEKSHLYYAVGALWLQHLPHVLVELRLDLGLLVNSLGWALAFRSAVGVLLTALILPPLLARIRAEEALLRTQFGDEYDAYRARTSRLIPGLY